jgi:YgiT-type zinc finger domain-containing protein
MADTQVGVATVTLERGGLTLVVKVVPAQDCSNCGEQVASELLATADELAKSGSQVEIRQYVRAS